MKRVQGVIKFRLSCEWEDTPPTYRVYFDKELLTERTYTWDNAKQAVDERVGIWLMEGSKHVITLIKVDTKSGIEQAGDGKFSITNIRRENADNVEIIVLT